MSRRKSKKVYREIQEVPRGTIFATGLIECPICKRETSAYRVRFILEKNVPFEELRGKRCGICRK